MTEEGLQEGAAVMQSHEPRRIADSVVVITGGAAGIGSATACAFAAAGARVVIGDIDVAAADRLAAANGMLAAQCDVRREEDVVALIDLAVSRHGRIDTMINNAGGVGVRGGITQIDIDGWRNTMALLFESVFFGMKHAARHMIPQGGGAILTTASNASVAALGPHVYAACKTGILGLTRSVAAELARHGITVNAVAPGMIPTALTTALYGEATEALAVQASPLGRAIAPVEIAEMFLFLAGMGGRNITGQTIVVDGGSTTVIRPSAHY